MSDESSQTYILVGDHAVHLIEVVGSHRHSLPEVDETFANIGPLLVEHLSFNLPQIVGCGAPQGVGIIELLILLLVTSDRVCARVDIISQ